MRNARVYITNDTGLDFSKAEVYGDLLRCTRGMIDPFKPHVAQKAVGEVLADFDASKDYLLLSGSALASALAMSFLTLHADDGRDADRVAVRLLMFDSKTRDYFVRTVEL